MDRMAAPSHATLATFRMDLSREDEQRAGLEQMIVPGVRRHPGFVSGTWTLDRDTSESFVMLTFETRDSAETMRANIIANADGQRAVGIDLVEVRLLEISAVALPTG
jgi:hypothetical protein